MRESLVLDLFTVKLLVNSMFRQNVHYHDHTFRFAKHEHTTTRDSLKQLHTIDSFIMTHHVASIETATTLHEDEYYNQLGEHLSAAPSPQPLPNESFPEMAAIKQGTFRRICQGFCGTVWTHDCISPAVALKRADGAATRYLLEGVLLSNTHNRGHD